MPACPRRAFWLRRKFEGIGSSTDGMAIAGGGFSVRVRGARAVVFGGAGVSLVRRRPRVVLREGVDEVGVSRSADARGAGAKISCGAPGGSNEAVGGRRGSSACVWEPGSAMGPTFAGSTSVPPNMTGDGGGEPKREPSLITSSSMSICGWLSPGELSESCTRCRRTLVSIIRALKTWANKQRLGNSGNSDGQAQT
jgi:hypothetical protein